MVSLLGTVGYATQGIFQGLQDYQQYQTNKLNMDMAVYKIKQADEVMKNTIKRQAIEDERYKETNARTQIELDNRIENAKADNERQSKALDETIRHNKALEGIAFKESQTRQMAKMGQSGYDQKSWQDDYNNSIKTLQLDPENIDSMAQLDSLKSYGSKMGWYNAQTPNAPTVVPEEKSGWLSSTINYLKEGYKKAKEKQTIEGKKSLGNTVTEQIKTVGGDINKLGIRKIDFEKFK